MVSYKLMYFNGRGLAELSRYVFVVSGNDYEGIISLKNK